MNFPDENAEAIRRMTEKGIRPSVQRIAILNYLLSHPEHPSVDSVYTALLPSYPTISRTTVYNTLHLFSQNNVVLTVCIDGNEIRYDGLTKPHFHFKCKKCGKIYDIVNDDSIPAIYKTCFAQLPENFSAEKLELDMWGVCAQCASSENS